MLYVFGISAFIYRLFLYTSIILIIYFKFTKPVAIILMAIEVYTMLLMPVIFELKALKTLRKRMSWAKTLLTALAVCGLVSLLFIPLPWSFSLPCEIVPETRRMVTVNESAFAAKELKDEPFSVEKGDLILPFRNVFLDFNIRRYEISADRNRAELNLLRSDTKTIGASPAVYEKLRANLLTQNEMKRRRSNMGGEGGGDRDFRAGDQRRIRRALAGKGNGARRDRFERGCGLCLCAGPRGEPDSERRPRDDPPARGAQGVSGADRFAESRGGQVPRLDSCAGDGGYRALLSEPEDT